MSEIETSPTATRQRKGTHVGEPSPTSDQNVTQSAFTKATKPVPGANKFEMADYFVALTIPGMQNPDTQDIELTPEPVGYMGRTYILPRGERIFVPSGVVSTLRDAVITKYKQVSKVTPANAQSFPNMVPVMEWVEYDYHLFPNIVVEELTDPKEIEMAPRRFEELRVVGRR